MLFSQEIHFRIIVYFISIQQQLTITAKIIYRYIYGFKTVMVEWTDDLHVGAYVK